MRRRAVLWVFTIVTLALVASAGALTLLFRHVPAFYTRSAIPKGSARQALSQEFLMRSTELWGAINSDRPTEHSYFQDQINGYLQEREGESEPMRKRSSAPIIEIPDEIHNIRVTFDDDLIRLGFRYGKGWWSTVVTIDFRVWLVARKPNVIALELCNFRAGAIPLGTQALLDYVSEATRDHNIEVNWYRHGGHPVALLQFQANQIRPTFQIRRLEVKPGQLVIARSPIQDFNRPAPSEPAGADDP
jgi:hypothetical protein